MYLKKLKVSGFKSFADAAALDFDKGICAVVGPNGSGKSNIVEAIRWVMGEQSMKGLRAKKGEDLIFAGTEKRPRMGKARVSLHFDNKDKIFPLDFEEVVIARKIFRDGENQYFINDSQVRLKDITELIARAKLGLKGYSIIGQGMGDAILNAGLKERREIIDGAVGLKEFQLKKNEAGSKLRRSKENLKEAKSLIREIAPHLKFLQKQAEKIQQKEELEKNLKEFEERYFSWRFSAVQKSKKEIQEALSSILAKTAESENAMKQLEEELTREEGGSFQFFQELKELDGALASLEDKNGVIQRGLGKLDALIEVKKSSLESERTQQKFGAKTEKSTTYFIPLDFSYAAEKIGEISGILKQLAEFDSIDAIKGEINKAVEKIGALLNEIKIGKIKKNEKEIEQPTQTEEKDEKEEINSLTVQKENILKSLQDNRKSIDELKEKIRVLNQKNQKEKERFLNLRGEVREKRILCDNLEEKKDNLTFELEKIVLEEGELKKERNIAEVGMISAVLENVNSDEMRRDIERIKIKLEVVGNIDPDIQKEYEETESRYNFLTSQSEDLERAIGSLEKIIEDLDVKIEEKFNTSFGKINKEFDKFFKIIFNGGTAKLVKTKIKQRRFGDEEDELLEEPESEDEEEKQEEGIDINVNLPKKKISGVSMLSGGERALTAVALLVALVSISKPPFLVLDEIDAPLDESNSARFSRILKELSQDTQFIIITHNRETMKQAGILYGVTMSDDGISKILSLKLE